MTFQDSEQWREELRFMDCDDSLSLAKRALFDEDDSENEEEPEPESTSITTYDEALRASNDLLVFPLNIARNSYLEVFKVVTELQSIKLKQSMACIKSNPAFYSSLHKSCLSGLY